MVFKLTDELLFPDPALADEDGLLAFGGDLLPERLILAYQSGIFPWFNEDDLILWYSPHQRFVLFPDEISISKSMKKVLDSGRFYHTKNTAFDEVIDACANAERPEQDGTWITAGMKTAYKNLYKKGIAHSHEIWEDEKLAGGLYGVEMNGVFCGESMFSRVSYASKAALVLLCQNEHYRLIDCQVYSQHLESMGARFISREEYLEILSGKR